MLRTCTGKQAVFPVNDAKETGHPHTTLLQSTISSTCTEDLIVRSETSKLLDDDTEAMLQDIGMREEFLDQS